MTSRVLADDFNDFSFSLDDYQFSNNTKSIPESGEMVLVQNNDGSYTLIDYVNSYSHSHGDSFSGVMLQYRDIEPESQYLHLSEPLSSTQWGNQNNGQDFDILFGGTTGADANIFKAYEPLMSTDQLIVDTDSGQNLIGIVDTGVRYTHYDLAENMIGGGFDIVDDGFDPDPIDTQGHGTHVAGIAAAARNSFGIMGANPSAKILPVKISNDGKSISNWDQALGVYTAMKHGSKVVNLSVGGWRFGSETEYNYYKDIFEAFPDALLVAAAGNDGSYDDANSDTPGHYPSGYGVYFDNIISVGSSDNNDLRSGFSNYGPAVDLFAPGSSINSSSHISDSAFVALPGTSMAAPLVAGAISAYWSRAPQLTAAQVKQNLLNSTDYRYSLNSESNGRLNMNTLFWGGGNANNLNSSIQTRNFAPSDAIIANHNKGIQSNPPDFQYDINLNNIDKLSKDDLDGQWIATLTSKRKVRRTAVELIKQHMRSDSGDFSGIEDFRRTGPSKSFTLIDLGARDDVDKRALLKSMLERGWFNGFDRNDIISLDLPETTSLRNTTTEVPSDYLSQTFEYSFFSGSLDDNLKGKNLSNRKNDNFVSSGPGSDYIFSGDGDDLLMGDSGDDKLKGQKGDDNLRGGSGNDTLMGGRGDDTIISGTGSDIIYVSRGIDIVTDFDLSKDLIQPKTSSGELYFEQIDGDLRITELVQSSVMTLILENIDISAFEVAYPILL